MIEVEIETDAWLLDLPDAVERVRDAAAAALSVPGAPAGAEISVLLSNDAEVAELNGRFRGKPAATNVLSFPAPGFASPHLGDIVLAHEVCAAEAQAQGKPLADHLSHLVVHGVLHLLGHDHQIDVQAEAMESLERTVLASLGVRDPYADRTITPEEAQTSSDAGAASKR